jgi:hypothetical protein
MESVKISMSTAHVNRDRVGDPHEDLRRIRWEIGFPLRKGGRMSADLSARTGNADLRRLHVGIGSNRRCAIEVNVVTGTLKEASEKHLSNMDRVVPFQCL